MSPYLAVAELTTKNAEPFAVVAIDPTVRMGNGCRAIVQSLHWTREEAEAAIATQGAPPPPDKT